MSATPTHFSGYRLIEQIYSGLRTLVYRGIEEQTQKPVMVKLLKHDYPSINELLQFRNQYTLTKNLNLPGIVQSYSLEAYRNGYALIMEDFGGVSLHQYTQGRSLSLEQFFSIALQVVETLHHLHQQRIIHKDIKPANILIQPDTQQVKLIDFSIASLLPRETQEIQNPNTLEGTLAYLSPEQTGRMNRGIDYRSDFYSLGITFFELLTKQLPFQSTDPMELVHCHLAKQPPSVYDLNSELPLMLSEIICKLMAKNAEDRYQSAIGLKHDLLTCQRQMADQRSWFKLGQRDISDRFLIPEKLYGRENAVQTLLDAFSRVANGTAELMLVAGSSGIGKTAVVNEVHKPIVRWNGYFIKGKFDQLNRNVPLSAFLQAFRDLVEQLLSESDAKLAVWKTQILETLGENGQIITGMLPELEQIIGKQPPVPELSGNAAQNRFNLVFQKFIQIFATVVHPLVIFLDDLQWADSASLGLIKLLMSQESRLHNHLFIVGAYRDNEVFSAHPLMLALNEIEKTALNIITLNSLSQTDINQLIADTFNCEINRALPLTNLVYQKAKGNPFFTTQFLKALHDDGLINFDWNTGSWQCDVSQVQRLALSEDVVEFMALQLQKLPADTQNALSLAACIGSQFDLQTLAIVSEQLPEKVAADLWKALQEGFVIPINQVYKFFDNDYQHEYQTDETDSATGTLVSSASPSVTYRFLHDRIQQAAYTLIPEAQRPAIHLKMGQLLLHHTAEIEQDNQLFDIVNHLNRGSQLITQSAEQEQLAWLNQLAAQRARSATAYESAVTYATTGIALLSPDCWQSQYDLALRLHELAAENAFLSRDFEQMEHWAETVLQQTKTLLDRVKIYEIKIQTCISQHRLLEAIALGRQVLNQLGVQLPDQPTQADTQHAFQHTMNQFAGRPLEALLNLPPMTASEPLAAIRIAASTAPAVYFTAPSLYPFLILSQVNASIQHGNAPLSAFFYASYGLLLNGVLEDMEAADRAGKLALGVLEKLNDKEIECKTRFILGALVVHGTAHLQTSLQFLRESYQSGLEAGDIEFAGHAAFNGCQYAYFSSQELGALEQDIHAYSQMLANLKQVMTFNYCQLFRQVALNLFGTTQDPRLLVSDVYDETQALPQLLAVNDLMGLHFLYLHKLILGYLFGDTAQSLTEIAAQGRQYLAAGAGFITVPIFYFYDSLVALAEDFGASSESNDRLQRVVENQAKLQKWAHHAPMNHLHKWHLVEAERCRVLGHKAEAVDQYDRAIRAAKENGYIQEAALSNELAAKFYLDWDKPRLAQEYLIEAYYGYARWGAKTKVADLERRYPQLLNPVLQQVAAPLSATETIFTMSKPVAASLPGSGSSNSAAEALDLASILKVSQALSSEIELDKLLATLLQVVIKNAGADRGVLLLCEDGELMLRAVAQAKQDTTLLTPQSITTRSEISVSLLNTVKHTLKPVVIVDATVHPQFEKDVYIQHYQPKSLLCSPIVQQGKLLGVLYLENSLTAGAFTSDRVELLNLLCAQAAISLENAQLYQQSLTYSQQLEKSLEALQTSETRFQKLAANVPGMIYQFCLDADGTASTPYVSSGCCDLYELEPEAVMAGKYSLYEMHHPDDHEDAVQAVIVSAQNLTPFIHEWRIITPSGKVKWIQSAARPERKADGSVVWDGIVIDVSDRKCAEAERQQAEIALRYSEERYRCLMATTSPIVWISTPDGLSVDSPLWCAYTGQELEALKNFVWLEAVHPDDSEHTGQVWNHARDTKSWYRTEYRIRAADGTYRYFDVKGVPILDEDGNIREWFGTCTDIDDRKRAEAELTQRTAELEQALQELQRTQSQMVQAEKMSSLGQLVAGVAHEINNPVNFIFGNLSHANTYTTDILELLNLYQHHYPVPHPDIQAKIAAIDLDFVLEDLPKILSSMRIGADRIQKIVASLRIFSRMDEAEMKAVNIHDGIDSTLMILQHRLKPKSDRPEIQIVKRYDNLPLVECYAGQLNQVFMNVLSNAIDALEESAETGNPAQRTASNSKPITITIRTQLLNAHQIEIRISDNGPGMAEAVRKQLFNPFFTTKPVGKGTGMGLSISYQIVTEKHGGSMSCISQPGQGAEFVIQIPIHQQVSRNALRSI